MKRAPRIAKTMPVHIRREREGMSRDHVRDVGDCPCVVCGTVVGVHCHHLLRSGERGLSLKSPDKYGIPLCVTHHNELHHNGDEDRFLTKYGIDGRALAAALWSATGDLDAMRRIIFRSRQQAALKLKVAK